jgi:YVTN family beta-propeller protein
MRSPARFQRRRNLLGTLLAAAFCHCSPQTAPSPARLRGVVLAPGSSLHGASLFGTDAIGLPTGAILTPDAAPGAALLSLNPHVSTAPDLRLGGAVASALSPDGQTLLLLTSGYNRAFDSRGEPIPEASGEWIFVYDVASGRPRETQVLTVPNSFGGLAFKPQGDGFYVSGGPDDVVHEFQRSAAGFIEKEPPIPLGHLDAKGMGGLGIDVSPFAAGLAVTSSGRQVVVANHENDSLTIVDVARRAAVVEVPLMPGGGIAGGEFPTEVVTVDDRAYVSCQRDREVVEVNLSTGRVARRIGVGGAPTKIAADRTGARLFVANSNSDTVSVIDLAHTGVASSIRVTGPESHLADIPLRGANPNSVALSPDERTLYVTNGGINALALVDLSQSPHVVGLVPTGFYPTAVSVAAGGAWLYVAHGKSPSRPNPRGPWSDIERSAARVNAPGTANEFVLQLIQGGLLAIPTPSAQTLAKLTAQTLINNHLDAQPEVPPIFTALSGQVKHVIYVIGENRTYDQLFGDLPGADGDPRLLHWGEAITPNAHALARTFLTLDRFFDTGGVSGDGWQWSTSGRTTDVAEKGIPVMYAGRGHLSYDWEGTDRNVNVGLPTLAERIAANPRTPNSPDLLPGTVDVAGVDEPPQGGRGFLWDAAMASRVTVRNYGFFVDDTRYSLEPSFPCPIPPLRLPSETQTQVAYATRPSLLPVTDPYFRGFDVNFADVWREKEWEREFDEYVAKGELPALELVRLPHDHLGGFSTSLDGVNTPDTQIADHDYALGRLVERVSTSVFWKDTVVIAIEDDAQNGGDHVDAHRSFALFAGGHVKRGGRVSTVYSTPSVLRTIELLLGLAPLGINDAFARPMADVLTTELNTTPFTAIVPAVLRSTELPLPKTGGPEHVQQPRGDASFWALSTRGLDFDRADALPTDYFNRVLFCGLVDSSGCATEPPEPACRAPPVRDPD